MDANYEMLKPRFEQEQRDHPVPVTVDDLPTSYESITPAWLTLVLGQEVGGSEVLTCRLGPADEGTSSRQRIYLAWNAIGKNAGLPASVFCKSTCTLKSRHQLGPGGFVEGEVRFYNQLRPEFEIEAPECLFANFNAHTFNSIVILKDIGDSVESCSHDTQLTRTRVENQIRLLARLHAKHHGTEAVRAAYPFLRTWDDTFSATAANGFREARLRGFTMAQAAIPSRLFQHEAEIWPATERSAERHQHLPHSVIHSDPYLKNGYIASDGSMGLNDWQCVVRGHWGRDLAYALSSGLAVDDRRAWERDLIHLYLECLAEHGVAKIGFDDAWTIYRQQLFGALARWAGTLGRPPNAPAMQPRDSSLVFIGRMTTAIDDLDALGSFVG